MKWVIGISLLVALFIPPFFFSEHLTTFEIRYYIFLFFAVLLLAVFGVLRLYNAIVVNTKFMLTLRAKISSLITKIPKITTGMDNLSKDGKKIVEAIKKKDEKSE